MFEHTIATRPSNPTYSLYKLDYHNLDISLVNSNLDCCNNAVYPNPSIFKTMQSVLDTENNQYVDLNDLYITHLDNFVNTMTANCSSNVVEFIQNSKIMYVVQIDADESNMYLVILN